MRAVIIAIGAAWGALTASLAVLAWSYSAEASRVQQLIYQQSKAAVAVVDRCSPVYELSWIGRECSGAARLLPSAVKSLACKQSVKHYRKHSLEAVRRKAEELGPDAAGVVLQIERGDQEQRLPISWRVKR